MMALLLQLNGDLPKRFPYHERRLYLFTCRKKQCRRKEGSIRGFRATRVRKGAAAEVQQKTAKAAEPPKQTVGLGTQLFGSSSMPTATSSSNPFTLGQITTGANPFASSQPPIAASTADPPAKSDNSATSNTDGTNGLAETYASKLSLGTPATNGRKEEPAEPWPESSNLPQPFTRYYLDADYETLSVEEETDPSLKSKVTEMEADGESSTAGGGGTADDKELFESSMDKTFQRFADRLRHNPEQVLRYEFDGTPLLYSSADDVSKRLHTHDHGTSNGKVSDTGGKGPPSCTNCGAKRKFELQLTPHAIEMLEADEPASAVLDGMDWGTIILGVCENDCPAVGCTEGESGYVEEWVGVQWEELTERAGAQSGSKK